MGDPIFAKVDAHLDSNPKIVKGGRLAREVYQFVLRRNWARGAHGGVPASDVDTFYLSRMLFMPEPEAREGLLKALEVRLLVVVRDGVTLDPSLVTSVTDLRHGSDFVGIDGWDPQWGRIPRSGAERMEKYRNKLKSDNNREPVTKSDVDDVTGDASDVVDQIRLDQKKNKISSVPDASGTGKSKADKVPDRAWKAADHLRTMVLAEDPSAAVGRKPWSDKTGMRLKWADSLRLLVERDGRTYEEIWEVMQWLRYKQPAGVRFIVQSADALREKWDRIRAVMRQKTQPAARGELVDAAVADMEQALAERST